MLADLSPDVALLRGVDIALAGRLHIEADGQGDVRSVEIDVTGGNGTVTLPGVLPASHQVKSVNARATVDAATHTAKIERIDIDFGAAKVLDHRHRREEAGRAGLRRPGRGAAHPGRSPGRLLAAGIRGRAAGSGRWPISATARSTSPPSLR